MSKNEKLFDKILRGIFLCFLPAAVSLSADEMKTKNVILIMNDGVRWQEMFSGADEQLLKRVSGPEDGNKLRAAFWRDTPSERRKALSPFLWEQIAAQGQIFGNQNRGSVARVANSNKISYPGYNEAFTGSPDSRIESNKKILNTNTTIFEWLNRRPGFKGKVAAVASWDVFPYILNVERGGFPIWPPWETRFEPRGLHAPQTVTARLRDNPPSWKDLTFDYAVHEVALDCMQRLQPRLLFVGYGEADEWAHEGRYDQYLKAIRSADDFARAFWNAIQSEPHYRDQTTLIITADHGRGLGTKDWREHGQKIAHSENIWMAVIGPDTPTRGERSNCSPITLSQVAATIASLLGEDLSKAFPKAAPPVTDVIAGNH